MKYEHPHPLKKLSHHLKKCPIHTWRAKTGIELIHQEPYIEELKRIWKNWNLMTDKQKEKSNKKSKELFGMTNENHYKILLKKLK